MLESYIDNEKGYVMICCIRMAFVCGIFIATLHALDSSNADTKSIESLRLGQPKDSLVSMGAGKCPDLMTQNSNQDMLCINEIAFGGAKWFGVFSLEDEKLKYVELFAKERPTKTLAFLDSEMIPLRVVYEGWSADGDTLLFNGSKDSMYKYAKRTGLERYLEIYFVSSEGFSQPKKSQVKNWEQMRSYIQPNATLLKLIVTLSSLNTQAALKELGIETSLLYRIQFLQLKSQIDTK